MGFPNGTSSKESTCQCRRYGFDPWVEKIPWRRKWQSTPVFLPGKSHGQRNLEGYSPWGPKESDMTEHAHKDRRWKANMFISSIYIPDHHLKPSLSTSHLKHLSQSQWPTTSQTLSISSKEKYKSKFLKLLLKQNTTKMATLTLFDWMMKENSQ